MSCCMVPDAVPRVAMILYIGVIRDRAAWAGTMTVLVEGPSAFHILERPPLPVRASFQFASSYHDSHSLPQTTISR